MTARGPIVVIEKAPTFESADLLQAAEAAGVPMTITDIDDPIRWPAALRSASLIYWRSASLTTIFPKNIGRVSFLTAIDRQAKVVNRAVVDTPQYVYKSVQQARVEKFAAEIKPVKTIPTFLASDRIQLAAFITEGQLRYPFIAKPNLGRRGEGVVLIEDESGLAAIEEKLPEFVFQNFISNHGDFRVFVVGGAVHEVMLRSATERSSKQFLNNISQGGQAKRVEDPDLRKRLIKAGGTIAAIFGYTVCGVDLIADEAGQLYFLEVNSAPEWKGLQSISPQPVARHIVDTLWHMAGGREGRAEDLFATVRDYWFGQLRYLPPHLRFHFLSRLHLWSGRRKYQTELQAVRDEWWAEMENVEAALSNVSDHFDETRIHKSYRYEQAKKFFPIETYNRLFFKCLFDRTIFGGQEWESYRPKLDLDHLRSVRAALLGDAEAILTLSTAAVNFLYFCDLFLSDEGMALDPKLFLEAGEAVTLADPEDDADARLYMYTHAVIGATRFYDRELSDAERSLYRPMLQRVETLLSARFAQMSLDHKCEFLVCCRLIGYESPLEMIIRSELESSVAEAGAYFINRHNIHAIRYSSRTLVGAEHSNVLALMAFLDRGSV